MPFSGYVDADVLHLTQQAQALIDQTKTLVSDIDETIIELNQYRIAKQRRLEEARAKWQESREPDA